MSSSLKTLSSTIYPNSTTPRDCESREVVYAYNIFMLAVSACVLTVTAVACCVSYVKRRRGRKRARKYESAVARDLKEDPQVNFRAMQRWQSLEESLGKDDDSIYYIYINPLPVMDDDDGGGGGGGDEEDLTNTTGTIRTFNDPKDGIILDPLTCLCVHL